MAECAHLAGLRPCLQNPQCGGEIPEELRQRHAPKLVADDVRAGVRKVRHDCRDDDEEDHTRPGRAEANAVVAGFNALAPRDQQALLTFLRSL